MKRNPDAGQSVGIAVLGAACIAGVYFWSKRNEAKPGIPANLAITEYANVRTGETLSSGLLTAKVGDTIRVYFEYDYFGPAISGKYHAAVWEESAGINPHIETANAEKSFDIDVTDKTTKITGSIDIKLPSILTALFNPLNMDITGDRGLYIKIMRIPEDDIVSPYYANRIKISWTSGEVPGIPNSDIMDFDFVAKQGAYNLGDSVPFSVSWKYKGKAQSGVLKVALGTGIVFSGKFAYPDYAIDFPESLDWRLIPFSGTLVLPASLDSGQSYGTKANIITSDGVNDSDTDNGVISIIASNIKFTLYKPIPLGESALPGPVLLTIPIRSDCTNTQVVTVKTSIYEGSWATPASGKFIRSDSETITIQSGQTIDFKTTHVETTGTTDQRDVKVELYVGGKVVASDAWANVYRVESPYVNFRVEINSASAEQARPGATHWMAYYWDPFANKFKGDSKWHPLEGFELGIGSRINFDNVGIFGYLAVFILSGGAASIQYTSQVWTLLNNHTYEYYPSTNRIVDIT